MSTATLWHPCVTSDRATEPRAMTAEVAVRDIREELSLYPGSTPEQVVDPVRRLHAPGGHWSQHTPKLWGD